MRDAPAASITSRRSVIYTREWKSSCVWLQLTSTTLNNSLYRGINFFLFSQNLTSRAPLYQTFDSTWWMLDRIVNRMLINLWSSSFFLRNWTRFEKKGEFLFSSSRNNGRKEFYDRLYSSPDVKKNFHSAGRQWMNLPWISMISYAQRMRVYIYIHIFSLSLSLV